MPRSRGSLDDVMEQIFAHYSVREKDFGGTGRGRRISEARGMEAWLILELGVCTLGELGKVMGRDITTLSSAAKRLQTRASRDLKLAERMKALFKAVSENGSTAGLPPLLGFKSVVLLYFSLHQRPCPP
jgi:putative transposase